MTVIAVRGGIMAADTRETWGDDSYSRCEKIFRKRIKGREHVIGTAGSSYSGMVFVDWYGSGKEPPETLTDNLDLEEDFEIIIWDGRRLYTCNHLCRPVAIVHKPGAAYAAVGCGRKAALGAMAMGATARRAVEVACDIDPTCGLPLTFVKLSRN